MLVTGATNGIGLETCKKLVSLGHHVIIHGRTVHKVEKVKQELSSQGTVDSYTADLSNLNTVTRFADAVLNEHDSLDVLINNAGVLKTPNTLSDDGLDMRVAVNTIAPYLLTKKLLPILSNTSRVINLSSAAQDIVNLELLSGNDIESDDMSAYSQSKLALTMWSRGLADSLGYDGPTIIAVNPGSLLASKMVKEGFGVQGKDLGIGADILVKAALFDEFKDASGKYFDNDSGHFSDPHPDALSLEKINSVISAIDQLLDRLGQRTNITT